MKTLQERIAEQIEVFDKEWNEWLISWDDDAMEFIHDISDNALPYKGGVKELLYIAESDHGLITDHPSNFEFDEKNEKITPENLIWCSIFWRVSDALRRHYLKLKNK